MKSSLGLTLLLTATGVAACAGRPTTASAVGDYAPPFALTASDGATIGLADLLPGGPVLLYFNMAYG
jgi:cytochrome oxidase Cu insertion factor (SCO1/SenC/PrrC family)